MKDATLQTLITARALFEQAERHCALGDRYLATAGLIVLQDAFELVLYAVLVEKGADEDKKLENLDFDGMIAEVGKRGIKVPKSGTLRAMNKLRVTAKHYGQIMEPTTVQWHLEAAKIATDTMLTQAVGKTLREIFLTELVGEVPSKSFLEEAICALANREFGTGLIATRKAFFIEFEEDYCVYAFRQTSKSAPAWRILQWGLAGLKAPAVKLNAEWIGKYVHTPFDYVQIDNETWKMDAMEWGINTQTLANIQRLTPQVIRLEREGEWYMKFPPNFSNEISVRENAALCLDLTIEAIRRKHDHIRSARSMEHATYYTVSNAYIGKYVLSRPSSGSSAFDVLNDQHHIVIREILTGFDPSEVYYEISFKKDGEFALPGYIQKIDGEEPVIRTENIRQFLSVRSGEG